MQVIAEQAVRQLLTSQPFSHQPGQNLKVNQLGPSTIPHYSPACRALSALTLVHAVSFYSVRILRRVSITGISGTDSLVLLFQAYHNHYHHPVTAPPYYLSTFFERLAYFPRL